MTQGGGMRRLLMVLMVVAGIVFALFAGYASRTPTDWPLTSAALFVVAGACFLLASSLKRKGEGE